MSRALYSIEAMSMAQLAISLYLLEACNSFQPFEGKQSSQHRATCTSKINQRFDPIPSIAASADGQSPPEEGLVQFHIFSFLSLVFLSLSATAAVVTESEPVVTVGSNISTSAQWCNIASARVRFTCIHVLAP